MAGDWIKFEHTTPDKPEVIRMATILRMDQDAVVGKLVRVWVWADQNSVDGNDITVNESFIDRLTAKRGFAAAMRSVNWLAGDDGSLILPLFDRHNGETAKARAESNRRMAKSRASRVTENPQQLPAKIGVDVAENPQRPTPNGDAFVAEKAQQKPQPEKRREENIQKEEGEEERGREGELLKVEIVHAEPFWRKDHGWQGISAEEKQRWKLAYPACDIERQLLQMDIWLRANPAESHKTQWMKFITGWLKREQDKGGDRRADRRINGNTNRPVGNPYQVKATTDEEHAKGF